MAAPPASPDGTPVWFLSLHKDWHVVHWLVAGTAGDATDPVGTAVMGGEEVGDDLGYGPAMVRTPEQVRGIAAALDALGVDALMRRYDRRAMLKADVYSADAVGKGEARHQLGALVAFYRRAADDGRAVFTWIS